MSRLRSFISVIVCLLGSTAAASWRVEERPLEEKPYGRSIPALLTLKTKSALMQIEGSGVELAAGQSRELFVQVLPASSSERMLELQLGFVGTEKQVVDLTCEMTLTVTGAREEVTRHRIPLRSIEADVEPLDKAMADYDYFLPQLSLPLKPGVTEVRARVDVSPECTGGRPVAFDPKIWIETPGVAPRRLIFVTTDSLGAAWFEAPYEFMPATRRFFSEANGGRIATNVFSVGTNTHDVSLGLSRMRFQLRKARHVRALREEQGGLVPSFLNAGYEALGFGNNVLMTSAFELAGFRNSFDNDMVEGASAAHHPELAAARLRSWLRRHPDHDLFAHLWMSATHVHGKFPRVRPGLDHRRLPYKTIPKNAHWIVEQANQASYTDLVLEELFADPLVQASDVLFFSDHGINFDTLHNKRPYWGSCDPNAMTVANHHVAPVETRIVVAARIHGYLPPRMPHESSLFDWVKTATLHHDGGVDVSSWEGLPLEEVTAQTPILISSHERRVAMRVAGRQWHFSEETCRDGRGPFVLDEKYQPAPAADAARLLGEFDRRGLLRHRRIEAELVHGEGSCELSARFPLALGDAVELTSAADRWISRTVQLIPDFGGSLERQIEISTQPERCGRVQVAGFQVGPDGAVTLASMGLSAFLDLPAGKVRPDGRPVLRLQSEPGRYRREGDGYALEEGTVDPAAEKAYSAELKKAMKRWGYIQDDRAH